MPGLRWWWYIVAAGLLVTEFVSRPAEAREGVLLAAHRARSHGGHPGFQKPDSDRFP
jgi:hypothetical protein